MEMIELSMMNRGS